MSAPKKPPKLPATVSLAILIQLTGEEERQIQRIVKAAGIEVGRNVYPLAPCLIAIKDHYKAESQRVSVARADDKARREKAEADSAEIDLAEKLNLLCFRADIEGLWRDGNVKIRQKIQQAKDIPEKTKQRIVQIIQSVKLDPDEIA
jgi:hypothetical protein